MTHVYGMLRTTLADVERQPTQLASQLHCIYGIQFLCRYESRDELVRFIDEVVDPAVLEAGLGEGGEVSPGSLMAAARRTGRSVAHALLLCANWKGTDMFTKKRPELISVYTYVRRFTHVHIICICTYRCMPS